MKVIDLLQRIANGEEVPSKIRFNNIEWNRVYGEKNVCYIDEYDSDFFIYLFRNNLDFTLNDKVEIIEDKKIKKLETYDIDGNIFLEACCFKYIPIDKEKLTANEQVFADKINEIIDYIMEDK